MSDQKQDDPNSPAVTPAVGGASHYPDQKTRDLSDDEKDEIRKRLTAGISSAAIAEEFGCAETQVAGIKAWMTMR